MTQITAQLVNELRQKTGAGMMDAKKALTETAGDFQAAEDWLRQKGLSQAAKKASRAASEGLVAVVSSGTSGAVLEVNAETDFVSRNPQFQAFVRDAAAVALQKKGDLAAILSAPCGSSGKNVQDELTHLIATIGENMTVRRARALQVSTGVVASYVHNALSSGLGKIGVLVALESSGDAARLDALGRQIAMHIAATAPASLSAQDLDPALIEREKNVLRAQARDSGKPAEIIEKMIEGRMRKYYEEVCLLEQVFVIDGESRIAAVVAKLEKDLGTPVKVTGFVRFALGEGVEKKEEDFAQEVKKMMAS